jgi:hypothetical protein
MEIKHIFEIDESTNSISLTPEFETDIKNAKNPQIILIIGNSRSGKSSLLNAILSKGINIDEPFSTSNEIEGCTKDFNYIKMTLNSKDIFLVDSEGAQNINGVSKKLKIGLLVLQSIVDIILFRVEQSTVQVDVTKELVSYMAINKIFGGNNKYNKTIIAGRDFRPKGKNDDEKINNIKQNSRKQTEAIINHVINNFAKGDDISNNFEFINLPNPDNQCFSLAINNLVQKLESCLNQENNGEDTKQKLKTACSLFKLEPNIFEMNDNTQKLLFDLSKNKLNNEMNSKMAEILNREKHAINQKTPKELREFNTENYYSTKTIELINIFNNKCEEDFHQLKNFLEPIIEEVFSKLIYNFFNSLKNIVQTKYNNTNIYPKNIPELLKEQKIPYLTKGKEYELFYNRKPYKIIALDRAK